jgi:hypothetical protein
MNNIYMEQYHSVANRYKHGNHNQKDVSKMLTVDTVIWIVIQFVVSRCLVHSISVLIYIWELNGQATIMSKHFSKSDKPR